MLQKFSIIAIFILSAFASAAQVQRKAVKNDSIQKVLTTQRFNSENGLHKQQSNKQLLRSLNLNKQQKQQLKEMHKANRFKRDIIKNNDSLSEEQKQTQLKDVRRNALADMSNILSAEQMEKMKEQKHKH